MQPHFLKKGDTIGILSTARKINEEALIPAIELAESWGLQVLLGKTIGASVHQYAGSDELRSEDFQDMLDNPTIKAIWCAKGGYGTVRMIDAIDFSAFKKHPKWIIGYSDITVLHAHINAIEISTMHASIAQNIEKKTQATRDTLKEALFGNTMPLNYESQNHYNRLGEATGTLVGGNLSVLYSLLGSPSMFQPENSILFIEDIDEMLYHIDRMMQNLKRSGFLKTLAGLVVGGMTDMRDNIIPFGKTANQIIAEAVSEYNFPVCFDFPAGHIDDNIAMVLGSQIKLKVEATSCSISYLKSHHK